MSRPATGNFWMNEVRRNHLRLKLLQAKGFRYLRYLHLRDFLSRARGQIVSVGVCGAGHGFAELTLALEFPEMEFTLTDVVGDGRPNYWVSMQHSMRWQINNVRFGIWDVLAAPPRRFDVVVSTEVLEHIEQADMALANQRKAAIKGLYCLTPFATRDQNANAERRLQAYRQHGHFVCGFDEEFFRRTLGEEVEVHGTYWHEQGGHLRSKLAGMSSEEVTAAYDELLRLAERDLIQNKPREAACFGVKALLIQ